MPPPRPVRIPQLVRRTTAELLGTAFLLSAVLGSGIAAQQLSPDDLALLSTFGLTPAS